MTLTICRLYDGYLINPAGSLDQHASYPVGNELDPLGQDAARLVTS